MSTERYLRRLVTWSDDGTEHVDVARTPGFKTPASIPRAEHLVDAYDPAGHLVAVLTRPRDEIPPLVYQHNLYVLSPSHALTDDGLFSVTIELGHEGRQGVVLIGPARPAVPLDCPSCREAYDMDGTSGVCTLDAKSLREAMARKTARRAARILLSSSHVI